MHATEKPAVLVEDEMTGECINFSRRRAKVYSSWLIRAIRKAKRSMNAETNVE
ncbi:hypothetical protein LTR43_012371, partial [Exophiala xenobiotica]